MRARAYAAVIVASIPLIVLVACGGDDTNGATGGNDAGQGSDGTIGSDGSSGDGARSDGSSSDAAADVFDAGFHDLDATPPPPELVSPASCPVGLAIGAARLYWTENQVGGCAPAVHACPLTGCADAEPPAIYTGTSGQSSPVGIGVVSFVDTDNVYYADNQIQNGGLWTMLGDGGMHMPWGSVTTNGSGVTMGAGNAIFWAGNPGVYANSVTDAGSSKRLTSIGGIAAQGIGVDIARVFAWDGVTTLYSCPVDKDCTPGGDATATTVATVTNVRDVVSDSVDVFFTAETSSDVTLYRCPVAGCPSATPVVLAQTATTASPEQYGSGLATDSFAVYWGSTDGTIYACAKNATAPCAPHPWVRDANLHPIAFGQDATYLYWTDARTDAPGVYRVRKP